MFMQKRSAMYSPGCLWTWSRLFLDFLYKYIVVVCRVVYTYYFWDTVFIWRQNFILLTVLWCFLPSEATPEARVTFTDTTWGGNPQVHTLIRAPWSCDLSIAPGWLTHCNLFWTGVDLSSGAWKHKSSLREEPNRPLTSVTFGKPFQLKTTI